MINLRDWSMKKFEYFQERFFKYLTEMKKMHPVYGEFIEWKTIKSVFDEAVEDTKLEASGKTTSDKRESAEWAMREEERGNPVQDFDGYMHKKLKAIRDGEV